MDNEISCAMARLLSAKPKRAEEFEEMEKAGRQAPGPKHRRRRGKYLGRTSSPSLILMHSPLGFIAPH